MRNDAQPMSDDRHHANLAELERLLNDPEVPMQASRVWALVEAVQRGEAEEPIVC